ncbi:hypothetical protein ACFY2H_41430 [Streptomyces griseofuscus]|uniref:hypothetical protein n=1 Tax=Streptomyces griseofuscus TaxID=146922 RepID=UPI0036A4BD95
MTVSRSENAADTASHTGPAEAAGSGLANSGILNVSMKKLVNNAGAPAPPSWEARLCEAARVLARS